MLKIKNLFLSLFFFFKVLKTFHALLSDPSSEIETYSVEASMLTNYTIQTFLSLFLINFQWSNYFFLLNSWTLHIHLLANFLAGPTESWTGKYTHMPFLGSICFGSVLYENGLMQITFYDVNYFVLRETEP